MGCAGPSVSDVELTDETVLLDVRTPEEFAENHLQGARNVDVSAPTFVEQVRSLAQDRRIVVYCQTGNRSSQAVDRLRDANFEDVGDAGGMEEAAESTGRRILQGAS